MTPQYYFTKSGQYGELNTRPDDVTLYMVIPTHHWSKPMWDSIHNALDSQRYDLANHFSVNVHRVFSGKCKVCKLSANELEGQWIVGEQQVGEKENPWQSDLQLQSETLSDD